MNNPKHLIVILGPTAVGKTASCITLAQQLQAEIVSADARQCYQKMNIGTAKPTPEEQATVPHHLIDFLPLEKPYSAGAYQQDALNTLSNLWEKRPYAILTGGSGLYIDAVCHGLPPMPTIPPAIQASLYETYQEKGLSPLLQELQQKDPAYYAKVDQQNPKRIIRALEICRTTSLPFTLFRKQKIVPRHFNIIKIGLQRPREELYERINQRVNTMMTQGLWEEATNLYPQRDLPSLATIGYQEIFDCLDGKHDQAQAITLIKQHTRHYAKRQETWFKKDPSIQWFHPQSLHKIKEYIQTQFNSFCKES